MSNFNNEYNLTIQQENIWLIEQLNNNTNINNVTGVFYIKNLLNLATLQEVMNKIIENNDALRIKIKEDNGQIIQYFSEFVFEKFPVYIFKSQKEVKNLLEKIKLEKFNIKNDKLYNITIIQDTDTTYVCVKLHHIVSDAWTLGQVAEQIKKFYNAIKNNIQIEKNPSYLSYIQKDLEYRISERFVRDKNFWGEYVKNIEINNNFENIKSTKSFRIEKKIQKSIMKKITEYCKSNGITEYCFFLAVISIYFMKIFGQEQIVIGTPFFNRSKRDQELEMLGMFISTLPIKIDISNKEITFLDLCKNIATTNMSCFKHSKYPYYEIQKEYQKNTSSTQNLYEIAFSYQINELKEKINGDTGKTLWLHNNSQANQILISYVNHFGENKIYYDVLKEVFNNKDIEQIHNRILTIIQFILNTTKLIKVSKINILSQNDILQLKKFNHTGNVKLVENTIISKFKKIVKDNLNEIAVKCGEKELTYKELDLKSDYVANNLKKYNITQKTPVSIIFDKSIEMIITMLGIMKAGGYYIPILPEEEAKRRDYIIQNSDSKIIITDQRNIKKFLKDNIKVLTIEELLNKNNDYIETINEPQNLAYMIYTSGTTGNPKGVMIEHQNVVSLMDSINKDDNLKFIKGDVSISLLKYSFDASAIDIYTSLLNGGKLILVSKENELNPEKVVNIMQIEGVTRCFTVHKWIEQIQKYANTSNLKLRVLGTGGEVLKPERFKNILRKNKNMGIYNTYGPTETTMFITKHKVNAKDIKNNVTPIGGLVPNVRAIVVNTQNQVLPINVKGELVIYEDEKSSKNISGGYYKLEEQTNEKFITFKLPYSKKLLKGYKTGDMVKLNNNLELEFFGRKDDFVKISGGYLVSLNEVENTIQRILEVNLEMSLLLLPIRNENELVLFVVKNKNITKRDIEKCVNENLTFYMRPKHIIELVELPRNKNGKIDRRKLTQYVKENIRNIEIVKPTTKLEKIIYEKVKKIVKRDFSIIDDFESDLGIDSLNMTSLYVDLKKENLSIQDLYNYSSVKDLARLINSEQLNDKVSDVKIEIPNNSQKFDLSKVLLLGVTGFLGVNLLQELVNNKNTEKVYCLIRGKLSKTPEERLKDVLEKYFSKSEIQKINKKVEIINGDLINENFGIDSKLFEEIMPTIKTIINSAANVKHVGKYKDFYMENVVTVNNILEVCKKYKISLAHISTLSLNGMDLNNENQIFTENVLNIGQTFSKNPYLISKYEAEKNILKAIKQEKINCKIFRIGNIMPRVRDGKFQINYSQNAFMLAIKEICKLDIENRQILDNQIYLSPVDECSIAILKILNCENSNSIYHIESDKSIKICEILELVKNDSEKFKIINIEELKSVLYKNYNIGVEHLKSIIENRGNNYSIDITINLLKKNGFEWSELKKEYIENIINIAERIK